MRLSRILGIIQTEVSAICRSEAEADNADRGLNNSEYLAKAEFNNSFIIHSPRKIGDGDRNKKHIVFNFSFKK